MRDPSTTLFLWFDEEVVAKMDELAEAEEVSCRELISRTLNEHFNKKRRHLRTCVNCGKRYIQKSVKRNPNDQYFCSSVDRSTKCRQKWHDAQKQPNRIKRVLA